MDGPLLLARRLLQRLARTNVDPTDLFADDVAWYASVGGLEPVQLVGRENVLAGFQAYSGTWEGLHFAGGATVVDGDRALVFATEIARGAGSGIDVEQLTAIILTVRDGRIADIVTYLDLPAAYRDFGIDPADVPALESGRAYELRDGHPASLDA
jgi:ketosteroid isomerase-like protein